MHCEVSVLTRGGCADAGWPGREPATVRDGRARLEGYTVFFGYRFRVLTLTFETGAGLRTALRFRADSAAIRGGIFLPPQGIRAQSYAHAAQYGTDRTVLPTATPRRAERCFLLVSCVFRLCPFRGLARNLDHPIRITTTRTLWRRHAAAPRAHRRLLDPRVLLRHGLVQGHHRQQQPARLEARAARPWDGAHAHAHAHAHVHACASSATRATRRARYAALLKRMADARAEGPAAVAALEAAGARKDEGMALVLQILLMSECEALFGSYASNVAILVHDLMLARMVQRRERMHAVDVNGRTYCGCGASFCMKLEKRAGREPRRGVRNMVEAFRGSNINAI